MATEKDATTAKRIQYLFADIAKSVTGSLELEKIIKAIMKQVDLFFHPTNWSLLRVDPLKQELYFAVAKGLDESIIRDVRLKIGEGIAGHVAKTRESMLVDDTKQNNHFTKKVDKLSSFTTQSIIAVPIVYKQDVLGVIELINTLSNRQFTKYDLAVLEIIADFSAIAIANSLAYERMTALAKSDPLTGLYNRAHLDKLLITYNHSARTKKRKTDKSYILVIMIDINKFKHVNDNYGHAIGDEVLCKTATLLQSCCRNNDLAFRVGGDEFLMIIQNLQECDLLTTIARFQKQLTLHSQQVTPAPGFSFGIVSGEKMQLEQLLVEADDLMYKQKHNTKKKKKLVPAAKK